MFKMRSVALATLALFLSALSPVLAQTTISPTAMLSEINTRMPNNTTGLITPAVQRQVLGDMITNFGVMGINQSTHSLCVWGTSSACSYFASINTTTGTISVPPAIETVGGQAGGGLDNAGVIAGLAPGWYALSNGIYRVGANIAVPKGVVLDIHSGSSLAPDVATTTTFRGSVNPNVYTKIFTGSGTVTGLAFARPEWWGITGTADNISIQKAINSIENSFGSDGSQQKVGLACTVYNLAAGITLSPTNLFNDDFNGCGNGNTGTTFNAAVGFSGTTAIIIAGQARGTPGVTASYNIGNFLVTNSSGTATLACLAHAPTSGTQLEGNQENPLHDIDCNGFKYGYTFGASRSVHGDRLGFFSTVQSAQCFQFAPNDALSNVGDSDFTNIVCAPNQGTGTVTSGDTTNTSYAYFGTPNGGGVQGIGMSGDFYKSNNGFVVQAINGSTATGTGVSDIFIGKGGKTQIDGFQCNVLQISANSVGTAVGTKTIAANIKFDPDYVRGVVSGCTMVSTSVNPAAGAGGATVDSIQVGGSGGYFANLSGYGVIYSGATNSSVLNSRWLADGFAATSAIKLTGGSKSITVAGNTCQGGISSGVTISNASPAVITWTAHGLTAGALIQFDTNGALPSGLSTNTTYYVIAAGLTTNTFEVSATPGGSAINTGSAGSGTHTGYATNTAFLYDQFLLVDTNTDYINALPTAMNGLCGTEIVSISAGTHNSLNPTGTFVRGPNSSVNNNIATFSGTTGGLIQDSGNSFASPGPLGTGTPSTGAFTTLSATGPITSTQATGTPPFTIASTSKVVNLYVDRAASADAMASTGFANPTASEGLTAVNGTATTAMRSDGAPALSQSIVPTWSGIHTFSAAPVFSLGAKYSGSSSGTVTVVASATAGTPTITWGNASGTPAVTASAPLALSTTTGNMTVTGAAGQVLAGSTPAFTATPTLGVAGSAIGTLALAGNTSGTATITPQATAGSPTLTLPNASGTFAISATSPVTLSATTGAIACATCVTSSGGGAITGTAPVAVSAAGAVSITGAAGQVLAGSSPAFTATPTLGVAGSTVGSIALANATSGTVTLQPVTGALGSAVLSLPATTSTVAVTGNNLGVFAATTSAQLAGVISDETGSGALVFATSPTLVTPALGTPSSLTLTNATGLPAAALGGLSSITNSLGGDVALNNTANYFDGPSIAQGSTGTWWVSGSVTIGGTSGDQLQCKLWDGTTVIASGQFTEPGTLSYFILHLSGFLATPASNLRISCKDTTTTTGTMKANVTGSAKDGTISAFRIN